jgi:O-antigen/teichoic acid export membrane protein
MKQHIKQALKNPLIYGSTIVVFGNLFANFFNFLFNLFMSRSLSVTDYGILASIISLISFPALLANAINPVVIRFAGDYFVKGELSLVRGLYIKFTKFFLLLAVPLFIIFLLCVTQIGQFFHIKDHYILVLADIIMFILFMAIINQAFIQAKLAFGFQVFVSFVSAVVKLLVGILLVFLGYSAAGGVGALVMAALAQYCMSFYPLKFFFRKKAVTPQISSKELFVYGIPSALTLIGLTSFISTDILITKHFFDPTDAGLYAGMSLIGRIIFFVTVPICSVMFPIIVQKHSRNENYSNTFKLSALFVIIPSVCITTFYFLFPQFAIMLILKKTEYMEIAPLLGYFGVYISLYCLLYVFATFLLSIKKTVICIPILIGAFLQIVLISLYHNSFEQVITISFVIILLLVIGFLLYYPYATKK